MTGESPQVDQPSAKRRKVRKGTQSCWECRRRKVRCIFATAENTTCDHCIRRGTACISQELPEDTALPTGSTRVEDRLGRVEELLKRLNDHTHPQDLHVEGAARHSPPGPQSSTPRADVTIDFSAGVPTPSASSVDLDTSGIGIAQEHAVVSISLFAGSHGVRPLTFCKSFTATDGNVRTTSPPKQLDLPTVASTLRTSALHHYEDLSHALAAAWPSQHDIDLICSLPVGISSYLHSGISTPYSSIGDDHDRSLKDILQLPPVGSHPVLFARKLLILGTFLQGIVPAAIRDSQDVGGSYHETMVRVVDTAIRLVTTNEDLITSVEGMECIMMEALYQNYAGKLHRAWMAVRRAITVAQMMALHRGLSSPSLRILTPETRSRFNADQIFFRLVEMDCYLSVMLGLPRTSLEARFASDKALRNCEPVDRMQRMHCAMADRILRRDETDHSETHNIDTIIQKAATEMPPKWWVIPNLSNNVKGIEVLHTTMRLMDQLTHYHLLMRLHLPFILRSDPGQNHEHSRITAVTASRETLMRFVAFRTSNPAHYYCRGTDFLAFIASIVLCLAYIDSRKEHQPASLSSAPINHITFLTHSRPSDRGLMEHTLDIIESMALPGTDAISSRISNILRPLLAIEAHAASGTSYSIKSHRGDAEALDCHGELADDGREVRVHIPYFGTITFEHCGSSGSNLNDPAVEQAFLPWTPLTDISSGVEDGSMTNGPEQWDLQGVDVALFDSLFGDAALSNAFDGDAWSQWAGS